MKSGFAQVQQAISLTGSGSFSVFCAWTKQFCMPEAAARKVAAPDGHVARSTRFASCGHFRLLVCNIRFSN